MPWLIDTGVAVHLLAVSVGISGPLVCMPLEWRSSRGDATAARAGRFVLATSLLALLLGGLIGIAVGWVRWNDGLSHALARLSDKVYFGQWEIVFSAALMGGHWFWWHRAPHVRGLRHATRQIMALLAGTNLLYHFPVLFVIISELLHRGETQGPVISSSDFRQMLITGPVLSRSIHVALASLAAGAILLLVFALRQARRPDADAAMDLGILGGRLALPPVLAQIPVGFWAFVQASPIAQRRLLGSDPIASLLFVLGLATSLWLAHLLSGIALGERSSGRYRTAIAALSATIIFMTLMSRRILSP